MEHRNPMNCPADRQREDSLRAEFARRLSDMYGREVPLYDVLVRTVQEHNGEILARDPSLGKGLDLATLSAERHGAVRVARRDELKSLSRIFRLMGMHPVGFYDLTRAPSGKRQPVIATAFRPVDSRSIERAPFRMFVSLLCAKDARFFPAGLRERIVAAALERTVIPPDLMELVERAERRGGVAPADAEAFLSGAVAVFAWDSERAIDKDLYEDLMARAPIAADILLKPHLNHLTPRSLDIEGLHERMRQKAIMKDSIEGPPPRRALIFLRQTSYRALAEERAVIDRTGSRARIQHRARFGEIEQRGVAMTSAGRALYDEAVAAVARGVAASEAFRTIPDDHEALRRQSLAWYAYRARPGAVVPPQTDVESLVAAGLLLPHPIQYEDFLPVSAAGIFGSNLDGGVLGVDDDAEVYGRADLEAAMGVPIADPQVLYRGQWARSLKAAYQDLGLEVPADLRGTVDAACAEAAPFVSTGC